MKYLNYLRKGVSLAKLYFYDMYEYILYNMDGLKRSKSTLDYEQILECHKIEKGLSLRNPRKKFGKPVIIKLLKWLRNDEYIEDVTKGMVIGSLISYNEHHNNVVISNALMNQHDELKDGGIKTVSTNAIDTQTAIHFLETRHSCRQFNDEIIKTEIVDEVIKTASFSPSQCNRQSVKVRHLTEKSLIDDVLEIQGCTRGFSEDVHNLLLVCGDLGAWRGPQQRNQVYVDGSLFAAGLLYSLHAHNLSSCALNMALPRNSIEKIKEITGVPNNFKVIMLIAFGRATANEICVAKSPRRSINKLKL